MRYIQMHNNQIVQITEIKTENKIELPAGYYEITEEQYNIMQNAYTFTPVIKDNKVVDIEVAKTKEQYFAEQKEIQNQLPKAEVKPKPTTEELINAMAEEIENLKSEIETLKGGN